MVNNQFDFLVIHLNWCAVPFPFC